MDSEEPQKSNLYNLIGQYFVDSSVNCIRISPNRKCIAFGSSNGILYVQNLVISNNANDENSKQQANDSTTSEIQKFVVDFDNTIHFKGHSRGINDIAFSPVDSDILASCSDDLSIRLWSISNRKCIRVMQKHTYHITTIQFSTKGNILVSGSADENVIIWDATIGKPLKTLAAHSEPVSSVSLSPDNSIIVSGSFDGLMRLFDTESGQCLKTLTYNTSSHGTATVSVKDVVNFPISFVKFSPNGKYILSSSLDGKIRLWDYMENRVAKTYEGPEGCDISENYICGTRFIANDTCNSLIVSGSEKNGVLIWDVQSKKLVDQFSTGTILDLDLCDKGDLLVCCKREGKVEIYETKPIDIEMN